MQGLSLEERKQAEQVVADKGAGASAQELLLAIYATLKAIDYTLWRQGKDAGNRR